MDKLIKRAVIPIMMLWILSGCGTPDSERMESCKEAYVQLVDEHNVVVALYADSQDEAYEEQLNRLSRRVKEIGALDIGKMDTEGIGQLMAEMESLMEEYEEVYQYLSEMPAEEAETEYCQVSVTLKNMTTLPFYEVYFYNAANEDSRVNLVSDNPETYDGLEVYNLVNLVMEKDQTVWHLETMDEDGLMIESADVDLAPYQGGNVVVEMYFSFDSNEGWLEVK